MSDGLTSDRMKNEQASWNQISENQISEPAPITIHRIMVFGFIGVGLFATAALWWQFGESVFMTSVMNAILNCF